MMKKSRHCRESSHGAIIQNYYQFNNNIMGILICKRVNKFVIKYCSDIRIAVGEYKLV